VADRMNRRAVDADVRGQITAEDLAYVILLSRDRCHYCGIAVERTGGAFDHVTPLDRGGPNDITNIVRSCMTCNRRKFTKNPAELARFDTLIVNCKVCGTQFKPRWAEWSNGRARTCSRSCAAKTRWMRKPLTSPEDEGAERMDTGGVGAPASHPLPRGGR